MGAGPQVWGHGGQEQRRSWGWPFAPRLARSVFPRAVVCAIPWDSLVPARPGSAAVGS